MNHRKDKDRRSVRFDVDHSRSRDSSRGKRLKPLNRPLKRPPSQARSSRRSKNPNNPSQATALALQVLNNSHRSKRNNGSASSRSNRSHRHSFKSSDRHSPWPSGDFDPRSSRSSKMDFDVSRVRSSIDIRAPSPGPARMKRGKMSFDDRSSRRDPRRPPSRAGLYPQRLDPASPTPPPPRRRFREKRSLKVVRFAPDVQVFEYPDGGTMPASQNGGPPGPAPNPPTLKRKGYSTTPPMDVLRQVTSAELAQVVDFTIHHIAYGSVKWPGKTDLRGLDLAIVRFEGGAAYVYENENLPPQGTGLNKPAEVSLVGCWPRKMDARRLAKYEQSLRDHCAKEGMTFIDYSPDIGRWRFRVTHF